MTIYNPDVMAQLISQQCLDKLVISFYGTTQKTYNKLQPGFDYMQVQRNIKAFMKLRKKLGWRKPEVEIHLLTTKETASQAAGFLKKWRPIVDSVGFVHYDGWAGKQPYNLTEEKKMWGNPAATRYPCHRLWTTMTVRCDGSVVPCCLDENADYKMGNAFTDTDPYNSLSMQEMRRIHLAGKQDSIPMCRDCTVWHYEEPKEWCNQWITQKPVVSAITPCI
jgi:radical SAM protein with 4Fe4S-binding SPASM domain